LSTLIQMLYHRTMRTVVTVVAASLIASTTFLLPQAPALAWGATGHEFVSGLAAEAFPEELPVFLRTPEAIADITVFGRELDRSKGSGNPHDAALDPGHFVHLDDDGLVGAALALEALPATREAYDTALRAKDSSKNQYNTGYLPYAIVEGWQQLVKDFGYWRAASTGARNAKSDADRAWFDADRQRRERLIVRDLGVWSHFDGDASQPMHVSYHFNGWGPYPNPQSFSSSWTLRVDYQSTFVRARIDRAAVKREVAPYRACTCTIWDRMRTVILDSHRSVVPFFELEKRGAFAGDAREGIAFTNARIASGASAVRDMLVDAWRASAETSVGYPMISLRDIEAGKYILERDDFGRD
jgi:hypothetical protein